MGTFFACSDARQDVHARVPSMAASGMARLCRSDGYLLARCLQVPVKTRFESRNAFDLSRYMRVRLLVNLRRSTRRAGKVEHKSRALRLTGTAHLRFMPSKHPFMLGLAS